MWAAGGQLFEPSPAESLGALEHHFKIRLSDMGGRHPNSVFAASSHSHLSWISHVKCLGAAILPHNKDVYIWQQRAWVWYLDPLLISASCQCRWWEIPSDSSSDWIFCKQGTWTAFVAPSFSLLHPHCSENLESEPGDWTFLSVSFSNR